MLQSASNHPFATLDRCSMANGSLGCMKTRHSQPGAAATLFAHCEPALGLHASCFSSSVAYSALTAPHTALAPPALPAPLALPPPPSPVATPPVAAPPAPVPERPPVPAPALPATPAVLVAVPALVNVPPIAPALPAAEERAPPIPADAFPARPAAALIPTSPGSRLGLGAEQAKASKPDGSAASRERGLKPRETVRRIAWSVKKPSLAGSKLPA